MTKEKKAKAKKIRTETIPGKYKFTVEEKKQMASDLAQKQIDKSIVEDEKKSVMAGYKDRIDRFNWEINKLSRNVVDGYEIRDFECRIVKDFKAHVKKYICIHSKKLIDTRPLDPMDYQREMEI